MREELLAQTDLPDMQVFLTPIPLYEWEGEASWTTSLNAPGAAYPASATGPVATHVVSATGAAIAHSSSATGPAAHSATASSAEALEAQLFRAEIAYQRSDFEEARRIAEEVMATSSDPSAILSAQTTHMITAMASGNPDIAAAELPCLLESCRERLRADAGPAALGTSLFCAMRIESILMAKAFDVPRLSDGIDRLPSGLKAYLGALMAQREIRLGNHGKAAGITQAFRELIGEHYPLSRMELMLLSAAANIMEGRLQDAENDFMRAWRLAEQTGIIMPLVELNYLLCGLPRHCLPDRNSSMYKHIESLERLYHKGWYGLRRKCGIEDAGETMTPVEWYVTTLVGLGWRNKEIAAHLRISENTVKHQLTSCYQKLGISCRADLRALVSGVAVFPTLNL